MNNFKDFGIKTETKGYIGNKIKMSRILNIEIIVHACKFEDSIKEIGKKRMDMQISIDGTMHVVFTSGKELMEVVKQIPANKYPFRTIIIERNDWLKFT